MCPPYEQKGGSREGGLSWRAGGRGAAARGGRGRRAGARGSDRLGILSPVGAITHTEEIGGEDTIEFDCLAAPEKGDRLLWRDPDDGIWREHVVVRTDEPLAESAHVYAESCLCELLGDFIEENQLVKKTAAQALTAALVTSRFTVGEVGVGADTHGALLYHTNALAALRRVESVWGGEAEVALPVEDGRVSTRTVNLPARRGKWRGARFTYGKNMAACTRTVLEDRDDERAALQAHPGDHGERKAEQPV